MRLRRCLDSLDFPLQRADMVVVVPLQRWVVDGGLPMPETGHILVTGLAALARSGAALLDGLSVIAPGDSDVVAVRRLGLPLEIVSVLYLWGLWPWMCYGCLCVRHPI